MSFSQTWTAILARLRPNQPVRAWSANRGYTGGKFCVGDADAHSITVTGDSLSQPRRIYRAEFEKIHALWPLYKAGQYPRSRLRGLSQHTTYIISIFHLVD